MKRLLRTLLLSSSFFLILQSAYGQGSITGSSELCIGGVSQYTVSGSSVPYGYNWNVPGGATLLSGQGSNTVNVQFNSSGYGQTISVSGNNLNAFIGVSVYNPPPKPLPLSGPSAICAGGTAEFTATVPGSITDVGWSVPGATVVSKNGNSAMINFPASYTGGQIIAYGISGACGAGPSMAMSISAGATPPPAPGTISGATVVSAGQNGVAYSVPVVAGAAGYEWTLPSGATVASGSNTKNITVNYGSSFVNGVIQVIATAGSCRSLASTPLVVTTSSPPPPPPPGVPGAAGQISGDSPCLTPGSDAIVTFSIPPIPGATYYNWGMGSNWVFPEGATGGHSTIDLRFKSDIPESSVVISVSGQNSYGSGATSYFVAQIFRKPAAAGVIVGPSSVCPGQQNVEYGVTPIQNAGFTVWTPPYRGAFASGYGTNKVTVNFDPDFTTGSINVFGVNGSCGSGQQASIQVSLPSIPAAAGAISGSTLVCPNATGVTYSVPSISSATSYVWSVPGGATITSGQNTSTITVSYPAVPSGTISVYGKNCIGNGAASSIAITKPSLPLAATVISGKQVVCPGEHDVIYSVPAISNATGYVWSVPTGATITSGQNTNSITVLHPISGPPGNVSVYGTNCIGNGPPIALPITPLPLAGDAPPIVGRATVCPGETGVVYSVSPIPNADGYMWYLPYGVTVVSGHNTNRIVVDFSSTASMDASFNISVSGTRCSIPGRPSSLMVTTHGAVAGEPISHSVDLVTGTLSASLPLFSVQNGDVQLPGVLSYSGAGVRITDDDGWSGQNWNLSVQSYGVFRQMRNLPDDYYKVGSSTDLRTGWLYGSAKATIKDFIQGAASSCADETSNYATLKTLDYNQDTEPDLFHVSAPGLSFDFYFDANGVPQVAPLEDVVITPHITPFIPPTLPFPGSPGSIGPAASTDKGPIGSFTVTDAKGVMYEFSEKESLTENLYTSNDYYFVRKSYQHLLPFTYTTSWRLTRITSPLYGVIDLIYNTITSTAKDTNPPIAYDKLSWDLKYNYRYPIVTSNPLGAGSTLSYKRSAVYKVPAKITCSTSEVEFISAPKYEGSLMQRLNTIKISDKRDGTLKLIQEITLSYSDPAGERVYLIGVTKRIGCTDLKYGMRYNDNGYSFPWYGTADKDEWNFYKINSGDPDAAHYDETAPLGSLVRITQPQKGFTAFFYQTHDYWDAAANKSVQGGGIRIRKILSYDGVSTGNDILQEFEYKTASGNSSGKLQHKAALSFPVARLNQSNAGYVRYLEYYKHYYPGSSVTQINNKFTIQGDQDMSFPSSLNGSVVAYERVTVKTNHGGQSVYEYDLPASAGETTANGGEWTASKVFVARPATDGTSPCYDAPNMGDSYYAYPFPVNSNYDFARGLLKKVTNFDEGGVKVSDAVYEYQRVYGAGTSDITKIYGLALETLPTYYYNGSAYVDGYMYIYSRYALFTNVKTEVSKLTQTVYNTATDLSQKSEVTTTYTYNSPNHGELTGVVTQNSDGTQSKQKFTYVKDYTIASPSGVTSTALANLKAAHRTAIVETVSSKFTGTEKITGASLNTFQTIGSKVYPFKQYAYAWGNGAAAFTPSSISGGAFQYDQSNYVLNKTYLAFDAYSNATEMADRSRTVSGVAYGYMGTLPIISVSNAGISEVRYSDFETSTTADFGITWPPTYCVGRNNSKGLLLQPGNQLVNGITNNQSQNYILSLWVKSAAAGILSVYVGTSANATFSYTYTASSDYTYYRFTVPVGSVIGAATSFEMKLSTSGDIQVDDLAFYPEQADFVTSTYAIPTGKTSETDSKGCSYFYENDSWGRPSAVYDRDKNVLKKYDYMTRP